MNQNDILRAFKTQFDSVGIIKSQRYFDALKTIAAGSESYEMLAVVALAYPKRPTIQNKESLVASFYTFGMDYHQALKQRIQSVMSTLNLSYSYGVDNHPHDERKAAELAHLGFIGRNQMLITPEWGSYVFLGMIFIDFPVEFETIHSPLDSCKDCTKCIQACPRKALSETNYHSALCISNYNQQKRLLSNDEVRDNYLLLGCDLCQLACPKNLNKGMLTHLEFETLPSDRVLINDLFTLSERKFKQIYANKAFLWRGKTLLMRNALTLIENHRWTIYKDLIRQTMDSSKPTWYLDQAQRTLDNLK